VKKYNGDCFITAYTTQQSDYQTQLSTRTLLGICDISASVSTIQPSRSVDSC